MYKMQVIIQQSGTFVIFGTVQKQLHLHQRGVVSRAKNNNFQPQRGINTYET